MLRMKSQTGKFHKTLQQTAPSAWCPKLANEIAHTPRLYPHYHPIIIMHKKHVKKLHMDLSWTTSNPVYRMKLIAAFQHMSLAPAFQKFYTSPKTPNLCETSFQKVNQN